MDPLTLKITKRFITALKRYRITSGYAEVNGPGLPVFELISSEVRALKDHFPHLYNELNAYSYKINATGTISFNAPSGYFDDCVMSLMLANESRTKSVVKKSGIYIGGPKMNEATKIAWGSGIR
jgi:hypothetical protein